MYLHTRYNPKVQGQDRGSTSARADQQVKEEAGIPHYVEQEIRQGLWICHDGHTNQYADRRVSAAAAGTCLYRYGYRLEVGKPA